MSSKTITKGKSVTVKSEASGGTGSYEYAVFYKKSTQTDWTTVQKFRTNSSVNVTPKSTGTYNICVKAKDSSGTIIKTYQNISVSK